MTASFTGWGNCFGAKMRWIPVHAALTRIVNPVRCVLPSKGVFAKKNGFSRLEAPMRLYLSDDTDNYVDCVVSVSGAYMVRNRDEKVLLTVRDITRLKKVQEELEAARRVAEVAGEQKTAFLANMSHEIRTPLNAIVGFAGLLSNASESERNSYVEIIKGNTNMLLQLVNDILDMSKIEAGTLEFIYSDTDVNQIMRELEGIFRLRLEEADSPVRIVFEPCLPVCFIHTEKEPGVTGTFQFSVECIQVYQRRQHHFRI